MKKYICMALALLMMATLFVGCGCTNRNVSDNPGGMITNPTVTTNPMPTMTTPPEPSTRETTYPTIETTVPTTGMTIPGETAPQGSSAPTDNTGVNDSTTSRNTTRRKMP